MQKAAVRGRRGSATVSPRKRSANGEPVIVKLKNGNELWFVRKRNGDPHEDSVGTIRRGEDGWDVIKRVIQLAYGTDDVESWARNVIGLSLVSGSAASSQPASLPSTDEAPQGLEPLDPPQSAPRSLALVPV